MSIMETQPQKILRSGWKAYVNDYAISGVGTLMVRLS